MLKQHFLIIKYFSIVWFMIAKYIYAADVFDWRLTTNCNLKKP